MAVNAGRFPYKICRLWPDGKGVVESLLTARARYLNKEERWKRQRVEKEKA
jgi:hypothetical protein